MNVFLWDNWPSCDKLVFELVHYWELKGPVCTLQVKISFGMIYTCLCSCCACFHWEAVHRRRCQQPLVACYGHQSFVWWLFL